MKLPAFLSSLLASFSKSRMTGDLRQTLEELRDDTLPPYKTAIQGGYDKRKWKAENILKFQQAFDRDVKLKGYRGNIIAQVYAVLQNMEANGPLVEKVIDKYFADDVMRDAITFLSANIIQYLEAMQFVTRYSRKLLIYVLTEELLAVNPDMVADTQLTQGEIDWIYSNRETFFSALGVVAHNEKETEEKFSQIPDVVATKENIPLINSTVGEQKTDPFRLNFIPARMNLIYHARLRVAEWQVARYKSAQEERKMLELRILQMKQADMGKNDPKVMAQVEYTQGRLQRLNADIAEMEQAYG